MFEWIFAAISSMLICGSNSFSFKITVADPELIPYQTSFAYQTLEALYEPEGWTRSGVSFCANPTDPDVEIVLALPDTVDELCAPINTGGEVSCAINGRAVINFKRWTQATKAWERIEDYRRYVINHEVGHAMGMIHRHNCTRSGKAPLMMQQSRDRVKCEPNSYPTSHEVLSLKRNRDNHAE
jgi:hypothetical protein